MRERGRETCVVLSHAPPTGDLAQNPGMCPEWESNQRSFGSQAGTQSTEPHQPGLFLGFNILVYGCRGTKRKNLCTIMSLSTARLPRFQN